MQYEVKHNFDVNELNNMNDIYIPHEYKSLIIQAHELTQFKTLKELLCINP